MWMGPNPIWLVFLEEEEMRFGHRHTEEGPCEDTGRRQPTTHRGERPWTTASEGTSPKDTKIPDIWPLEPWEWISVVLSDQICGTLLWWLQEDKHLQPLSPRVSTPNTTERQETNRRPQTRELQALLKNVTLPPHFQNTPGSQTAWPSLMTAHCTLLKKSDVGRPRVTKLLHPQYYCKIPAKLPQGPCKGVS